MEAILIRIKKDLPHIKKVVVLSDNATCYQNMLLPLVFLLLGYVHGIDIVRLIHTETQDGKGVLGSHFARSMQVLIAWVREGNNCITPTQTVIGLKSHGGLPNSVVELVEHDRSSLQKLVTDAKQMEKQLRACVSRANEVQVSWSATSSPINRKGNVKYSQCPDFELKVFAASGIGGGGSFRCSPSRNVCRVLHPSSIAFDDANREEEREQEEDECHPGGADDWDSMPLQDSSDSDGEYSDESQTEVIEMSVTTGLVTGVRIATQGQIRRRTLRWRHKPRQNDHSQAEVRSRDVVSFAVRSAILMHSAGEVFVQDRASLYGRQRSSQEFVLPQAFNSGWAARPKRGSLYGKPYIESFCDDIKSLFMEGERSAASKMGPGRMLEMLRINYPGRYDLPTENEIRQEITKLKIQASQRLLEGGESTAFDVPSGADGCQAALSRFVEEDPTIKPRAALARFRDEVPNSRLTDTQIKTEVSYFKSRVKAKASKVDEPTR
ncbi:hypothetical protein FI667_g17364, partial [Globisporangium splendens]